VGRGIAGGKGGVDVGARVCREPENAGVQLAHGGAGCGEDRDDVVGRDAEDPRDPQVARQPAHSDVDVALLQAIILVPPPKRAVSSTGAS
jgi:hypothetical protein